jgi:hypothetical protein
LRLKSQNNQKNSKIFKKAPHLLAASGVLFLYI